MKPFKCDNVQYFLKKNTNLKFTITDRFCERLHQYTTLWSEFHSEGLEYDSFRNKEHKFSSKI